MRRGLLLGLLTWSTSGWLLQFCCHSLSCVSTCMFVTLFFMFDIGIYVCHHRFFYFVLLSCSKSSQFPFSNNIPPRNVTLSPLIIDLKRNFLFCDFCFASIIHALVIGLDLKLPILKNFNIKKTIEINYENILFYKRFAKHF